MNDCRVRHRSAGFTLIEVLLATVLLAAGLALAFATVRASTTLVQRGEAKAQQNERMRAVQGFLRTHVGAALPVAFATDPSTFKQARFLGEPTRMRFVANLPAYLGRGGPHLYDLQAGDKGDLQIGFAMVQSGKALPPANDLPPELLARGLKDVRFRYRGLTAEGGLGPWQPAWNNGEILPLQVAIHIEGQQDGPWPEMIVSLRQSEGGMGGGDVPGGAP